MGNCEQLVIASVVSELPYAVKCCGGWNNGPCEVGVGSISYQKWADSHCWL